jgi:hypothetical protein
MLLLVVVAGCAKPVPPACDAGTQRAGEAASVLHMACKGRPLAVAWTDIPLDAPGFGISGNTSHGPGRGEDVLTISAQDGRRVELKATTADGATWVISINGQEYRPEDGAIFLVRTGGAAQVTQVKREVSELPANPQAWARLADDIPEVKAFLAEVGGKK